MRLVQLDRLERSYPGEGAVQYYSFVWQCEDCDRVVLTATELVGFNHAEPPRCACNPAYVRKRGA